VSKLTVELVKRNLQEKDEMKKVTAQKLKLSKHRKSQEVKNIKDPSLKLTKIKQVDANGEEGKKSDKGGSFIPQADFAHKYTDKMPHGQGPADGAGDINQKSPKGAKAVSLTPNQQTKLKVVKKTLQKTEDDGDQKAAALPTAKFAHEYTDKMPHGSKNLGDGKSEGGEGQNDPKVAKMAGGPTRKGGTRNAKNLGDVPGGDKKKTAQIKQHQDNMPSTKDSLKWKDGKYKKETGGAHNVVESGIALQLRGKTKATFEIVDRGVLNRMVENYESFGYKVDVKRVQPSWKTDRIFLRMVRESINAKYNFAPKTQANLRKAALNRFANIVKGSYNNLYESRQQYVSTIMAAYKKIESLAEGKYLDGLEIYQCTARIKVEEGVTGDLEIITEATDHQMALRQVRNQIAEEYGLDTKFAHIFVDGKKYKPSEIKGYSAV